MFRTFFSVFLSELCKVDMVFGSTFYDSAVKRTAAIFF